ncbi:MAG: chemotaxis-specific protein-glutamate methyltransferase CheB [SAR324 cluster bacterium]|nr:chemotaxis-specific protein-glutamate methyltransferase CheB [SAR324 cluster bacterium]
MMQPLKIMVVDDSSLYRRIMTKSVESLGLVTEVKTAPSGAIALKKIPDFHPDIVLLDIEMPEMNGIEVLGIIKREFPDVTVILVSGVNSRSADITIEGLSSGAADFIPKPTGSNLEENTALLRRGLKDAIDLITAKRHARKERKKLRSESPTKSALPIQPGAAPSPRVAPMARRAPSILPARIEIVGIGVSTGGPSALGALVPTLPKNFSVPVVIVQHMPPVFTESLARSLDNNSNLSVCEAQEGQVLEPGRVYIAPGGIHTMVKRVTDQEQHKLIVRLNDGPPVNSCKPAVDVLFDSLAQAVGGRTLAVIMTGMGHDGRYGTARIKSEMGYCLSQSEESCTVYGMPQAVDQAGLSDEIIHLQDLSGRITTIVNGVKH